MLSAERAMPPSHNVPRIAGETFLGALGASLLLAVPIALRVDPLIDASFLPCWTSLAIATLPASLLLSALARATVPGLHLAAPNDATRNAQVSGLAIWILLTTAGLAVFAMVLSSGTHHRGLGAATFAIVGVGAASASAIVALRLSRLVPRVFSHRRVSVGMLAASAAVPILWLYVKEAPRAEAASRGTLSAIGDLCLLAVLVVAGAQVRLPDRFARFALPSAALGLLALLAGGVPFLSAIATSNSAARQQTLILSPVLDRFGSPTAKPDPALPATPAVASAAPPASSRPLKQAPAAASSDRKREPKPDIILVTLDSVRADHVSAYGYKRTTTPVLDKLAAQSAVFDRAYAAGPETRTALTPVMTGRWLEQCVRDDRSWPTLLRANETLAERLRAQGYATGAVTSFQWLSEERGASQGFEEFDETSYKKIHPEKGVTGAHAIAQALEVYERLLKKDRPVFLWVHLFDAHQTYVEHAGLEFGSKPVDLYDGEIAFVDREVGRLIDRVRGGSREAKTVWMIHGSHGDAFGEHGFSGHPARPYEEVVRVPLIVRFPWAAARRIAKEPVSIVDLVPTVLELASASEDLPGMSLAGLVEGTAATLTGREGVLVSYGGIQKSAPVHAWISGDLKLIVHGAGSGGGAKLFDLAADPGEKTDLAGDRREDTARLRKAMEMFLRTKVSQVPPAPALEP